MNKKEVDYSKDDIKENCVVEFLCSLSDRHFLTIKDFIVKVKEWIKRLF